MRCCILLGLSKKSVQVPPIQEFPIENHGEPAVLYCFLFLFFAAWGAGEWSLDALRARRAKPPEARRVPVN